MTHKDELLAVMATARDQLDQAVGGYRDRLDAQLGDGWLAREAIAHIAVWERVATRRISGQPLPYGEELAARQPWNLDAFNNAMLTLMRAWSDAQILDEFAASHRALVEAVQAAPDADCAPKGRVWQVIDEDSAGHYAGHFPVVDEMAARWPQESGTEENGG